MSYFSLLEVTEIYYRRICEHKQRLPNDEKLNLRHLVWVSVSYKISDVIQKLTLILFPKLESNKIIVLFN